MPPNLASRPARLRLIIMTAVLAIAGPLIASSQAGPPALPRHTPPTPL
jgi:hypothetical protein